MIYSVLKIRLKQSYRLIISLGLIRAIIVLFLVVFGLLAVITKLSQGSLHEILPAIIILTIFSIHIKRNDKQFLKINSTQTVTIFIVEYLLLILPFVIILAINNLWIQSAITIISTVLIAFINIKRKTTTINSVFQRIIPNYNFEWKAGFRKHIFYLIPLWSTGIVGSYFIATVPIVIFILGFIVFSFYEQSEPVNILIIDELSARKFLFKKIKNHISLFLIISVPLVVLFMIFNYEYYYIPLIELVILSILLTYTILLKYAFYNPNNKSNASQIFVTIGIFSAFIPYLIPLVLILIIKFYIQAINNLKFYLDDFN